MARIGRKETDEEINQRLLLALDEAKAERESWESEIERITALLVSRGAEKVTAEFGDELITGTVVGGSDMILDEARLKRRVGAEKFSKVCRPVVDKKKLESAMLLGLIPPEWVAECTEPKPRKKHIRITRKKKGTTSRRK